MKAFIEVALMWGIALAVVLAVFLLNFWMVHHIGILIGASAARGIITVSVAMATAWILSFGGNKSEKPESSCPLCAWNRVSDLFGRMRRCNPEKPEHSSNVWIRFPFVQLPRRSTRLVCHWGQL